MSQTHAPLPLENDPKMSLVASMEAGVPSPGGAELSLASLSIPTHGLWSRPARTELCGVNGGVDKRNTNTLTGYSWLKGKTIPHILFAKAIKPYLRHTLWMRAVKTFSTVGSSLSSRHPGDARGGGGGGGGNRPSQPG